MTVGTGQSNQFFSIVKGVKTTIYKSVSISCGNRSGYPILIICVHLLSLSSLSVTHYCVSSHLSLMSFPLFHLLCFALWLSYSASSPFCAFPFVSLPLSLPSLSLFVTHPLSLPLCLPLSLSSRPIVSLSLSFCQLAIVRYFSVAGAKRTRFANFYISRECERNNTFHITLTGASS
jgi:hypothetical protein